MNKNKIIKITEFVNSKLKTSNKKINKLQDTLKKSTEPRKQPRKLKIENTKNINK